MNKYTKALLLNTMSLSIFLVNPVFASEKIDIDIKDNYTPYEINLDDISANNDKNDNIVDLLSNISGFTKGSKGNSGGSELFIRGKNDYHMNIVTDGMVKGETCLSRMDNALSFVDMNAYNDIKVTKGVDSFKYGTGNAGSIIVSESNPHINESKVSLGGEIGSGFNSNGNEYNSYAKITGGNEKGYAKGFISHSEAHDDYKDGDGNEINSEYNQNMTKSVTAGYTPTKDSIYQISFEKMIKDDVEFAAMSMDTISDDSENIRAKAKNSLFDIEAYHSDSEHLMDNYTLRSGAMMEMATWTDTNDYGVRLSKDLEYDLVTHLFGIDYNMEKKDATRYMLMMGNLMADSHTWPDAEVETASVFAESEFNLEKKRRLKFGARYDHVRAKAKAADDVVGASSPNTLYSANYGVTVDPSEAIKDDNINLFTRIEQDFKSGVGYLTLSRTTRSPSVTERFVAGNQMGMDPSSAWIGNPDLDQEDHYLAEIGHKISLGKLLVGQSFFYEEVKDFILKDKARGQDGVLTSTGATIYRNIDAKMYGFEMDTKYDFTPNLSSSGNLAYVQATNETDGGNIPQIPPLSGDISLDFKRDIWYVGSKMNFAFKQSDIETLSGQDSEKTPGYAVFDLYTGLKFDNIGGSDKREVHVSTGITNLFDKEYNTHMNFEDVANGTNTDINEPGRALWLKINAKF